MMRIKGDWWKLSPAYGDRPWSSRATASLTRLNALSGVINSGRVDMVSSKRKKKRITRKSIAAHDIYTTFDISGKFNCLLTTLREMPSLRRFRSPARVNRAAFVSQQRKRSRTRWPAAGRRPRQPSSRAVTGRPPRTKIHKRRCYFSVALVKKLLVESMLYNFYNSGSDQVFSLYSFAIPWI